MDQKFYSGKLVCTLVVLLCCDVALAITKAEKERLKDEAKQMFYHAYRSYMENAYPADELMPLSCKGRYRDTEPSRGDIDDALGNFSLTLVDSLDTLVILGDLDEFERAIRLVIRDVSFDQDVVVSVFETNIRVLGGLLSGHNMASYLQEKFNKLLWYGGELLILAKDLGYRLLPAFNTTTGVPHPRINLKYGLKSPKLGNVRETCTACAGTMILELAALSRLTGEPIFEEKAHRAMDYLWQQRHRSSDLVGTVLNIHNGDWVRRDSGVGAGIDSYYEYCLKAYILLGYESYLERFNKHYTAVMKYVSQGPLLVDVHMHRPHTNSRNFMDSLLAFWPGLQVLKGDIKPAIETHEMLYQVMQRHTFLPEAFTMDFQVHWGQYPLRPEFLESTYFLHKATGDNYYLEVGKNVLSSLQKYARVPCGYAAVKDVRTGSHEDRMDSFVLAETFKYLYLLFADKDELTIDMDDFIFTTEAHLLPLSLARFSNSSLFSGPDSDYAMMEAFDEDYDRSCPNSVHMFPGNEDFAHSIRQPLKNLVEGVCPKQRTVQRRLHAADFQPGNQDHIKLLRKMGITIMALTDGRVQLLQTAAHAETMEDAEEGVLFMQEMTELSRAQVQQTDKNPRVVYFTRRQPTKELIVLSAGPAQFGLDLNGSTKVVGEAVVVDPLRSCLNINNVEALHGKIAIVERGDCMFIDKARLLQRNGVIGGIVIDNMPDTSSQSLPMFAMSGDGKNDVTIPMVFLFSQDARTLLRALNEEPNMQVTLAESMDSYDGETPSKLVQSHEHLVPASAQGEAREVDVNHVVSQSETIYIRTKENGRLTLRRIVNADGTSTIIKVSEKSVDGVEEETYSKEESEESEGENGSKLPDRQREYLTTLQKLLETAMGDKQEIDPNTKKLLDQLSELMRPKPPHEESDEGGSNQDQIPSSSLPGEETKPSDKWKSIGKQPQGPNHDNSSAKPSSIPSENRDQNPKPARDDL